MKQPIRIVMTDTRHGRVWVGDKEIRHVKRISFSASTLTAPTLTLEVIAFEVEITSPETEVVVVEKPVDAAKT
jgi:hypothetical protein